MTTWRARWVMAAGLACAAAGGVCGVGAGGLTGCADEGEVRDRVDALEVDGADVTSDTSASDSEVAADSGDTGSGDGTFSDSGDTTGDTTDATSPDSVDSADATDATDTSGDSDVDSGDTTTVSDVVDPPWDVDPDAPWVLGRPIPISGTDGAAEIGAPVIAAGRFSAFVPVRIGSGSLVVDQQTTVAPETGGHAALVALDGGLEDPDFAAAVYLDGPLSAPERPSIAACGDYVYATINEVGGAAARLVRLSADLEAIDYAQFSALPGIGHSVKLGAPVCGGPGFVVTLDAVGGAQFVAPSGAKSEFSAAQSDNKSLILNGPKVFEDNAAQVVSATSMRILHVVAGPDKEIFYVGEATVQRQIGDTTLEPGDQLVYNHDYAAGSGGSIASQGWFGRDDIAAIAVGLDGRFAVVWTDVTPGATAADPELVEQVVSVFESDGAKAWNERSSAWAIDRVSFDRDGNVRIAGRFRSLEAIGVATAPLGTEDAFLAVLSAADGARLRHATMGVPGLGAKVVGPVFDAVGSGECADMGALVAMLVQTGPTRAAIGVGADARCATEALTAGDAELLLTLDAPTADATNWWLALSGPAIGGSHGSPWPAGTAAGPVRARFVSPL